MKMSVGVLDHYNVLTRKLDETVHFYEDVLGFSNGPRPPFNFPGAWLYSSGHAVLHLDDISQTEKQQRTDSGVIDHVAFGCRGFEAAKRHLSGKGVSYHVNQVPNSARWQIFLRDPNNVEIELNFESKNETGEVNLHSSKKLQFDFYWGPCNDFNNRGLAPPTGHLLGRLLNGVRTRLSARINVRRMRRFRDCRRRA
jgi:catechol 2,3-dioxygenase-like lactoylglutathione lyase family enzyme